MNICTQNNTTVEICLGKQLDLSGKERKRKKRLHLGHLNLNCVLAERYIIGAASSLQLPLHTKLKEQQKKNRDFKTQQRKELPTEHSVQRAHLANGECSF